MCGYCIVYNIKRFVWSVDLEEDYHIFSECPNIWTLFQNAPNAAAKVPVRSDDAYLCLHKEGADVLADLLQNTVVLTWN